MKKNEGWKKPGRKDEIGSRLKERRNRQEGGRRKDERGRMKEEG